MSVRLWVPALFAAYLLLFTYQEAIKGHEPVKLTSTLPISLQKSQGYLRQLGAEMLYIKVAVFLGGREPGTPPENYAERLANHFDVMATLHPKLLDIYYLSESSLPWINKETAQRTNQVLAAGAQSLPDEWIVPFFIGFNHFHYLDNYKAAATYLKTASQISSSPVWIGHLAATLAARGGDILVGLVWLRAMLTAEKDKSLRARYQKDINEFEKAARLLGAISAYRNKYGESPPDLLALEPEFINKIPRMEESYELYYESSNLHLRKKSGE